MPIGRPADESTLSRKPSQTRRRLRRAKKHADKTGDDSRLRTEIAIYEEATDGVYKPVEEWDLEELAHGRPRDKKGNLLNGPTPSWITADITREAKKRLYTQVLGKVGAQVDKAIRVVIKLMESDEVDEKGRPIVDARTQLDAAKWIVEHVVGKPTAQIEVSATDEVRAMFAKAIVLDDGRVDSHLVVEGEVVEDDSDLIGDDDVE